MKRICESVDYIPLFTLSPPETSAQDVEKKKAEPKTPRRGKLRQLDNRKKAAAISISSATIP